MTVGITFLISDLYTKRVLDRAKGGDYILFFLYGFVVYRTSLFGEFVLGCFTFHLPCLRRYGSYARFCEQYSRNYQVVLNSILPNNLIVQV